MTNIQDRSTKQIYDRSVAALVLGIIGFFPLGIIAIVLGHRTRKEYDQTFSAGFTPVNNHGSPVSRGMATAGFVLGIIQTSWSTILVLVLIAAAASSSDSSALASLVFA